MVALIAFWYILVIATTNHSTYRLCGFIRSLCLLENLNKNHPSIFYDVELSWIDLRVTKPRELPWRFYISSQACRGIVRASDPTVSIHTFLVVTVTKYSFLLLF